MHLLKIISLVCFGLLLFGCQSQMQQMPPSTNTDAQQQASTGATLKVGAKRFEAYVDLLAGKSVAVVANATSLVGDKHLVDALLKKDINVRKVFAPEHGFRGEQDAGEYFGDEVDSKTGLPIVSLYGSQKKPTPDMLSDIDIMVFDIQDVGVRFYTYLSTLHYVMESCAENNIPLVLLDRPNPNGFYIDGPVLKPEFTSFIGLHPVPLVYGMTIGEYGMMINGEGWLKDGITCDLTVVEIEGYDAQTKYTLPVKPSPNLPNMTSIYLYPSLALFEGTVVSIGRGTDFPFQVIGHPDYDKGEFSFTPRPVPGAMSPKLEGQLCTGYDLRAYDEKDVIDNKQISLDWLIDFYDASPDKENFFLANNFFNKLAGNDILMAQIKDGQSAHKIRESWQADLAKFRKIRGAYRLYN